MIVDTSAIIAVVFDEPDAPMVWSSLGHSGTTRLSAANLLEAWMVIDRRGTERAHDLFAQFMTKVAPVVEPVTLAQVELAREAWARYGKGSGHRAGLNFGDCFAYALARQTGEPLLFVGNDFVHTDLPSALDNDEAGQAPTNG